MSDVSSTRALSQTRFRVSGMDCAACAAKIEAAARRIDGVEQVTVAVATATLTLHHAPDSDLSGLGARLAPMGYGLAPLAQGSTAPAVGGCCGGHGAEEKTCDAAHPPHPASGTGGSPHAHDHDHPPASGHAHRHDDAPAAPADPHGHHHGPEEGPWWRSGKARLTFACGLALAVAFALGLLVPAGEGALGLHSLIYIAAMLVGLVPIARRAVAAARLGLPFTIEMLMTVAALGAVVIGAAEEAAAVVFLFLVGELLEGVAAGRARAGIRALADLVPKTALREDADGAREVPAATLQVGDVVLVRPGERVPADGTVLSGSGAVDEAPVTGESIPVAKATGDTVFAGTVNGAAALRITVRAAAADNTIARVVRLVEEAQEAKAPTERFIDRFARLYTPAVVGVAALVAAAPPLLFGAAWDEWIYKGLALLLIGCPCALVISTPAAIAAGLSAGARRGLLIKGGAVLETLGRLTTICFDKTGTLTEGTPRVTDLLAWTLPDDEVLRLAAALETGSSHPLAKAILAHAAGCGIAVPAAEDAHALGGSGVAGIVEGRPVFLGAPRAAALAPEALAQVTALEAEGRTVAVLVVDGVAAGALALRDEPRPDAAAGLAALAAEGISTLMLTGDNRRTAAAIGAALGIGVEAELMPQDKQRIVAALRQKGEVVAQVGDGINDAPALAAADVGIAMGGGTDVALETADAAVLHARVADIGALVALSRATMGNIRQNIAVALGLKAVFLVTTIAGITGLWPAILADTGATVLVTLNALRLIGWQPPGGGILTRSDARGG